MRIKLQQLALAFFVLLLVYDARAQRNRIHDVILYDRKIDINQIYYVKGY